MDAKSLEEPFTHKIKNLTVNWASDNTFHGLPNIISSKTVCLKIYWLIAFLVCTTLCLTFSIYAFIEYYKFEVTVSTTNEYEVPINFPAITICNLNPFSYNRASQFISTGLGYVNLNYLMNLTSLNGNQTAISLSNDAVTALRIYANSPFISPDALKSLGFHIEDMLISCSFLGVSCSASDFTYLNSYEYGSCYTFNGANSTNIKQISNAGSKHGLSLELSTGDQIKKF